MLEIGTDQACPLSITKRLPNPHGLGGKHTIGIEHEKRRSRLQYANHFGKRLQGARHVLNRHRHHCTIESLIGKRQTWIDIKVMDNMFIKIRIISHFFSIEAEADEPALGKVRREVRPPTTHQVE